MSMYVWQAYDFSRYFQVSPTALNGQASPRIAELATPRSYNVAVVQPREWAFTV
jgi:hypothetical protein